MTSLDVVVVVAYFALVFGIGAHFFRRARSSRSYFLADRSVGWIAVGASLFATNISSEHFIGLAGSGASSGLAVGHFEWLAVFMVMTLAWVGAARFVLELNRTSAWVTASPFVSRLIAINFLHFAILIFAVSLIILVVVSLLTAAEPADKLRGLTFATLEGRYRPASAGRAVFGGR